MKTLKDATEQEMLERSEQFKRTTANKIACKAYNDYFYSLSEDFRHECVSYYLDLADFKNKLNHSEPFTIKITEEYLTYIKLILSVFGHNFVVMPENCLLVTPVDLPPVKVPKSGVWT